MLKKKNIIPILVFFLAIIGCLNSSVFAAYGDITNSAGSNEYLNAHNLFYGYGKGDEVDHTFYQYSVGGNKAWCIEAGVPVIKGEGYYNTNGEVTDGENNANHGALSYIMYKVMEGKVNEQVGQAAVWLLTGNIVEPHNGNMQDVYNLIDEANRCNDSLNVPNASITVENNDYELRYDRSRNAYVSSKIIVSNGTTEPQNMPNGAFIEQYNDGVRIVVPATSVTGDISITLVSNCTSSGQRYGAATVWRKSGSQTLVTPNMESVGGNGTSAVFNLTAVGDLKVIKEDEHGKRIEGARFLVTGGPDNISQEIVTGEDGVAELREIKVGDYTITEIYVPGNLYISEKNQNVSYTVYSGYTNTIEFKAVNDYKRGQTQLKKYDLYWGDNPKGDCKLEKAQYGVYAAEDIYEGETLIFNEGDKLIEVETDSNGSTPIVKEVYSTVLNETIDGIPVGHYYWKELKESSGYLINTNIINFEISSDGTDIYEDDLGLIGVTQAEEPITGRGRVIKYNNDNSNDESENDTDKSPAAGAVLRLRLVSAIGTEDEERNTYLATIDNNGHTEFIDEEYQAQNPGDEYTIPYGTYEIDEVQASPDGTHTYFYMNKEIITINEDHKIESRIVADEPISAYLKIIKKDADSKQEVHIAGGKYMIWDCQAEEFVSQMLSPSGEYTNVFETNDEGYLYTPQKLYAGDYVVYEIEAPEGYYLDEAYRLPENEADYGDASKGGAKVTINTIATGIIDGTIYDKDLNLCVDVEIYNTVLKAQMNVEKKGEVLTGATSTTVEYQVSDSGEKNKEEKYTPIYTLQGLANVEYQIIAVNDIKSPDGRYTYVYANDVVDTIKTDENGYAQTDPLYLGEYRIVETSTPEGYLTDENIENVVLENEDQMVPIKTYVKELSDVRQKLQLTFKKVFEDVKYADAEKLEPKALFGVYTKEIINNNDGEPIIPNNKLVDLIWVDENYDVTSQVDLPEGTYYVKELYASYPYGISTVTTDFTLEYNNNPKQEFVVVEGPEYPNTYESASITLVKLATSTMDNIILNGNQIDTSTLDEEVQVILDQIKGMTKEEIKEYFEKNEVKFVSGAKYGIYTDKDCTKALRIKNEETGEYEEAVLVTDDTGLVELNNVPLGMYYVKEIEAPAGYEPSDEVIQITLDNTNKDTMIYQALIEEDVIEPLITKTDIFTGEAIPNCVFEIRDENDELLLKSVTDEQGKGYIPVSLFEDGKTYTYTEVEAPDIYDLNTEPHEFVAKYDEDGNWDVEPIKVENRRKDSTVTLEKLDMMDSTPIPNCKFELKSLETDWKVEGVTDENGVYVFENVPYGKYTYTELEAPEEYLIDTTPHEITIDAEEMKIQVTNEKAPDTGDIAVIAIASIAVVCALGIVFVVVRNKKRA